MVQNLNRGVQKMNPTSCRAEKISHLSTAKSRRTSNKSLTAKSQRLVSKPENSHREDAKFLKPFYFLCVSAVKILTAKLTSLSA